MDTGTERRIALLTNCTNRKRGKAEVALCIERLPKTSLRHAAKAWFAQVQNATPTGPAANVYCGRGMNEALAAASSIGADLTIVSAGLGLVDAQALIPIYDLTVSGFSHSNVLRHCGLNENSAHEWWAELNYAKSEQNPITVALRRPSFDLAILAVSNSYLRMVAKDLAHLTSDELKKIRIITHSNSAVDDQFGKCLMPYTSKFDSPYSPRPGTKADFAQRAAFHFCTEVLNHIPEGDAEAHWIEVDKRISILPDQQKFKRTRMNDEQIVEHIRRFWVDTDGQSSKMLRLLRDREKIACEQGRFKALFTRVADELGRTDG